MLVLSWTCHRYGFRLAVFIKIVAYQKKLWKKKCVNFHLIVKNLIEWRICCTSILHFLIILLLDLKREERPKDGKDKNNEENNDDDNPDIDRVAARGHAEEPGQAIVVYSSSLGSVGKERISPVIGLNYSVYSKVNKATSESLKI